MTITLNLKPLILSHNRRDSTLLNANYLNHFITTLKPQSIDTLMMTALSSEVTVQISNEWYNDSKKTLTMS
ncbi:MAG: hypothetical protein DWP95_05415 [Proteobacteria bacterium]|nr:MAG: hypothetical protein DWP95_05415 [Pseudomonadota bacterium]